nr:MAG TPA: hypothetical protein [Caudoviricetes sp.]
MSRQRRSEPRGSISTFIGRSSHLALVGSPLFNSLFRSYASSFHPFNAPSNKALSAHSVFGFGHFSRRCKSSNNSCFISRSYFYLLVSL